MKFCSHCDNMLYIKINETDNNQLNYYCRSCGFEDSSLTEEALCILDTQIQKKEQKFNHIVNKFTKLDPTLPRIYNMKCPQESCLTNTGEQSSKPTESLVVARITRQYGAPLNLSFRVRQTKDKLRIVDVTVAGVSLIVTKRSEFDSIIRREGLPGLLRRLDSKSSTTGMTTSGRGSLLARTISEISSGSVLITR